jgi:DNA (cytosine-5)-methyltransferase 1
MTTMTAYYNEIDPYAAQWLRNLIAAGHIAAGEVDERSIEDVHPADLADFEQCHFFAGIGVWSLALRRAGWPDDRPVWTGSCPCQPFSAAGKGAGFADERHLWPAFHWLIGERRPAVVLGEQVASSDVNPWIDLVQDDLEGLGYRVGAVPFPSAGVGAPHIRDRLYWMANADDSGRIGRRSGQARDGRNAARLEPQRFRDAVGLAHYNQHGRAEDARAELHNAEHYAEPCGSVRGMGNAECDGLRIGRGQAADIADQSGDRTIHPFATRGPGPTNGFWGAADWLGCRDGKWRPVEPGTFPLAHGAAARVGRLRAYGNAINAEAARVFIEAVMECQP